MEPQGEVVIEGGVGDLYVAAQVVTDPGGQGLKVLGCCGGGLQIGVVTLLEDGVTVLRSSTGVGVVAREGVVGSQGPGLVGAERASPRWRPGRSGWWSR